MKRLDRNTRCDVWDRLVQSTHKQPPGTGSLASRAHKANRSNIIIFLRGAQAIRLRVINEAQHPSAQKLTRPDGEIRGCWTLADGVGHKLSNVHRHILLA